MSDSPAVKIMTTRTCRWTLRLSVSLREKGVPYELVDVLDRGRKADWFLAATPFGKTPVLQHGSRTLPESLIICEYIDETFASGRPLLPRNPIERAWARVWLRFCDDTLIKALSNVVRATEAAQHTRAVAALVDEARRLDAYIGANSTLSGAGSYWEGSQLTLPDIGYYTFFDALERTGTEVRDNLLAACPQLARWRQALLATVAFQTASRELEALPG